MLSSTLQAQTVKINGSSLAQGPSEIHGVASGVKKAELLFSTPCAKSFMNSKSI